MNNPSRENLIGYLIGALDEDQKSEVEDALASDVQLRSELKVLGRSLALLEPDRHEFEPPPSLAHRTCQFIAEQTQVVPVMSPVRRQEYAPATRWTFTDFAVAAGIFLAASLLMLPAISSSRANARFAQCQDNLRRIGFALTSYSENNPQGMFPTVPLEGNLAAGGSFAHALMQDQYLDDDRVFFCSADPLVSENNFQLPRLDDVMAAQGDDLRHKQALLGGSYAQSLGHMDNGQYTGIRNQRRSKFALVSDAPDEECGGSDNHGGCNFNVLFEDGSVRYVSGCNIPGTNDHMFRNHDDQIAPGTHPDDSVITRHIRHVVASNN